MRIGFCVPYLLEAKKNQSRFFMDSFASQMLAESRLVAMFCLLFSKADAGRRGIAALPLQRLQHLALGLGFGTAARAEQSCELKMHFRRVRAGRAVGSLRYAVMACSLFPEAIAFASANARCGSEINGLIAEQTIRVLP